MAHNYSVITYASRLLHYWDRDSKHPLPYNGLIDSRVKTASSSAAAPPHPLLLPILLHHHLLLLLTEPRENELGLPLIQLLEIKLFLLLLLTIGIVTQTHFLPTTKFPISFSKYAHSPRAEQRMVLSVAALLVKESSRAGPSSSSFIE